MQAHPYPEGAEAVEQSLSGNVLRTCRIVASSSDAPEVPHAAVGAFDEMAVAVSGLVVDGFALSVDATQDDRDLSLLTQTFTDGVGVIALVGDKVARAGRAVEQQAYSHHIRQMVRRQLVGIGPPERVGQGADHGCLAIARETDRPIFAPFSTVGRAMRFHVGTVDGGRCRDRPGRRQSLNKIGLEAPAGPAIEPVVDCRRGTVFGRTTTPSAAGI